MIEILKKVDSSEYPYLDTEGCSHKSKKDYLQSKLGFCGCGMPDSAMVFLGSILKLISNSNGYGEEITYLLPSDGVYYFVHYMLDDKKLTEHDGSVAGSWLTDKGKEVLSDIEWCIKNEMDLKNT